MCGYDEWYKIEKEENGIWIGLNYNNDYMFKDIARELDRDGVFETYIDWSKLYGELESGKYRLIKRIYNEEYQYFYKEFFVK